MTRSDVVPHWEVYLLPMGGRDHKILAIPWDQRGKPVILWYQWYRQYGDTYFRTILHTGWLSAMDLKVIAERLAEATRPENPVPLPEWRGDPSSFSVDPFKDGPVPLPERRQPGPGLDLEGPVEVGGVCSGPVTCGDDEDHTGGPPSPAPSLSPPHEGGGGVGGAPGGGGHGGAPPGWEDERATSVSKLARSITDFLPASVQAFFGDKRTCQKMCAGVVAVPSAAALDCNAMIWLRAIPETGVPCIAANLAALAAGGMSGYCGIWCDDLFDGVQEKK